MFFFYYQVYVAAGKQEYESANAQTCARAESEFLIKQWHA